MKHLCACGLVGLLVLASAARADNAVERVRGHAAQMSYIDNGSIRIGVDLNAGGAITYLSRSGSGQNLVNNYDFGRQIQMSFYSGPVPFAPAGKSPKPEWSFIGWNPIQVGDAFGNPTRVLRNENDGKRIHVVCIPMHWPLENVPGECTYESWIELEGKVAHVRCKLINQRPDHTQYPARGQELPALYTNGRWHRLMTYTGERPFTGEAATRITKAPGEAGPWSTWTATECWAALVDDGDFGLGIWSPGRCQFGGGFSGAPGTGGPADPPTGYIAPGGLEVIDWNIEHDYRFDLIVGKLPEIRRYVYDHAERPRPPEYRFDKDRRGWSYVRAVDTGWPIRGELNVKLEQDDPQLIGPVGFWNAADAGTAVIEAASHSNRSDARLFWRSPAENVFAEARSRGFLLQNDGAVHAYRVKLAGLPAWKGAISQLRFDPIGAGAAGDWIRVKSVALVKE